MNDRAEENEEFTESVDTSAVIAAGSRTRARRPRSGRLPAQFVWSSMSLFERVAAIRAAGQAAPSATGRTAEHPPLAAATGRWLAVEGITEQEFAWARGAAPNTGELAPAAWRQLLAEILAPPVLRARRPPLPIAPDPLGRAIAYPFLVWARDALDGVGADLRETAAIDWPSVQRSLLAILEMQLAALMRRPLVLAVNIARLRRQLVGDSGDERFRAFVQSLVADEHRLRRFYLSYPALARLLADTCLNWSSACGQALHSFGRDRTEIVQVILQGRDPARLCSVQPTGGDPHNGGRQVLLFGFESGAAVIYKPRPLAVDRTFQDLLRWLNDLAPRHLLPVLRVTCCGDHGWMEFVKAREIAEPSGLNRFYWRQGAYIALLHALGGTDFHAENLIARGDEPVPIDLEALFRLPTVPDKDVTPATRFLRESVLTTGLLPFFRAGDPEARVPEFSGLGLNEGQVWATAREVPEAMGTDTARYVRKQLPMKTAQNRPAFDGKGVTFSPFQQDIVDGFCETYALLLEHRDGLVSEGGRLDGFANAPVRQVLRGTVTYTEVINRAQHPDFLRDTVEMELALSSLGRLAPSTGDALRGELRAMRRGEVPLFNSRPAETGMYAEGELYRDNAGTPSLHTVRERLRGLTVDEIGREREVVRLTLLAAAADGGRPADVARPQYTTAAELLATAPRVMGRALCEAAICRGDTADWIALQQNAYGYSSLKPAGIDVYQGVGGIGLALAYLAARYDDERFWDVGGRALNLARHFLLEVPDAPAGGAFAGRLSCVYALLHGGTALRRTDLLDDVERSLRTFVDAPKADQVFDVISGSAGAIAVMLAVHATLRSAAALELAAQFGRRLLEARLKQERGWGWPTLMSTKPLTGLSHGAAGIGFALLRLAAVTGEPEFEDAGRMAFEYERSRFMPQFHNWADLREPLEGATGPTALASPQGAMAWCHGAPGIGLSRAALPPQVRTEEDCRDVEVAVRKVLSEPPVPFDCVCHGELGNLEAVSSCALALGRAEWAEAARARLHTLAERRVARGLWACGISVQEETPSFMVGTAGIAFSLLRMQEPERVPSILALEAPLAAW